jgi:hypothetical protein
MKRITIHPFARDVILALFIGAALMYGLKLRMDLLLSQLQTYQAAPVCNNQSSCRQLVNANVISGVTIKRVFETSSKRGSSFRLDFDYSVETQAEDGRKYKVNALPLVSRNVDGVYSLDSFESYMGSKNNFAEEGFPVSEPVQVEIWMGKPVLLLTQYLNTDGKFYQGTLIDLFGDIDPSLLAQVEVSPIAQLPDEPLSISATEMNDTVFREHHEKTAVLTVDHPIWVYSQAASSYTSSRIGIWFIVIVFVIIRWIFSSK